MSCTLLLAAIVLIGCETADVVDIDGDAGTDELPVDALTATDGAFRDRAFPDLGMADAGREVDLESGHALYTQYCGSVMSGRRLPR